MLWTVQLTYVRPFNSIAGPVTDVEIADFVVLSGPNGSGKSNLLQAINQGHMQVDGVSGGDPAQLHVRLFALAELVAAAEGTQSASAFRDRWIQLKQIVESHVTNFTNGDPSLRQPENAPRLEQMVCDQLTINRQATHAQIDRMISASGKRISEFGDDDFRSYAPLITGVRDAFSMSIGELFLTYHQKRERNQFYQWREAAKAGVQHLSITDEAFLSTYGPPPWDLLNETLSLVGLGYRFEPPAGTEEDLQYEVRLIHIETGDQIPVAALSSGEKTLLAVAMSLYTGSRLGDAIELPKVLLLDESDASLHPSMVRSLLRVVDEIFVQRYGVKVIMTTHSPTTVALASDDALYTMRRVGSPRLKHVSRDDALSSLLVGLPTLSVKTENRRQVFVESEYDQSCYQELFRLLRTRFLTPFSLEFIASGRGEKGGGSDNVKHLVKSLRDSGNDVFGILDRDDRQGAPAGIVFAMGRYSIENLILDPVTVAILLLREGMAAANDIVGADIPHFEVGQSHAQAAADYVTSRTTQAGDDGSLITVAYLGGGSVAVPRFVLDINGHDWEKRLTDTFLPLRQYGKALMLNLVQRVIRDCPQWTPADVKLLFDQLLS
jgi:energy-coupling factor transporter ATP-binding protein EcfA2